MNNKKPDPPRLALVALRFGIRSDYKEALVGDLIEKFRQGKSLVWFWRQTVCAITFDAVSRPRSYWPHFVYAFTAVLFTWFFANADFLKPLPKWLHWSSLSWPWSQIVFELSRPSLLTLAALSILALGLYFGRSLHWHCLAWTGLLSIGVIALSHFSIDAFPFLLRPDPDDRFHRYVLVTPVSIRLSLSFGGFFVAAFLGCRRTANTREDSGKLDSRTTQPEI